MQVPNVIFVNADLIHIINNLFPCKVSFSTIQQNQKILPFFLRLVTNLQRHDDISQIIRRKQLFFQFFQNINHKLIKKNPAAAKKIVQNDHHFISWNHASKQRKASFSGIHSALYIKLSKVPMKIWKLFQSQQLNDLAMFRQPRKPWQISVS